MRGSVCHLLCCCIYCISYCEWCSAFCIKSDCFSCKARDPTKEPIGRSLNGFISDIANLGPQGREQGSYQVRRRDLDLVF